MRAQEGKIKTGLAAAGDPFELEGGIYQVRGIVHSHSGLTFALAGLGPDGSTYQDMMTGLTASGVSAALYLPPGQYKFSVTGSAGTGETWDCSVSRVPSE